MIHDDITYHLITPDSSVMVALQKLNELGSRLLVLFVIDKDTHILGTVTDGDIRRALVNHISLDDVVTQVMHRDFAFVRADSPSIVDDIAEIRARRIKLIPVLDSEGKLVKLIDLQQKQSYLPIDAVIMAGGKGERLRPLTNDKPKPLLKLGDKAIIDHNVDMLLDYGIDNIHVTVNHLREQLQDHFSIPHRGTKIDCVAETKPLGTIGALKLIRDFKHEIVLVMNSDIFTNINLEDFYRHFISSGASMAVAAVPYTVAVPYGIMELNGSDIIGVTEKPTFNYYANGGIYLIKRQYIDCIPSNTRYDATELIESLVANDERVTLFPINGTWIDIGTPEEYRKASDLATHLSK